MIAQHGFFYSFFLFYKLTVGNHLPVPQATPDEISYNAAIVACGKKSWEHAIGVFDRTMWMSQCQMCLFFLGGAVLAVASCSMLLQCFYIMAGLFHPCRMCTERIQPDIISYGSITHACGASGQWERALGYFQELRALGGKRS